MTPFKVCKYLEAFANSMVVHTIEINLECLAWFILHNKLNVKVSTSARKMAKSSSRALMPCDLHSPGPNDNDLIILLVFFKMGGARLTQPMPTLAFPTDYFFSGRGPVE